jgi:Ca2+-binding RTX toxin-like protein
MKRTFALTLGVATTALAAGIAWAGPPIIDCKGGPCTGTPAGETMNGSKLEDQISALGGNDSVFGNGADDVLKGGPGRDYVSENEGVLSADRLLAGPGDDYSEAGAGADVMRAGPGDDRAYDLFRGVLPEFRQIAMYGDAGPDRMSGGRGDDSIEGEEGKDVMKGGSGNDYIDAVNDDTQGTRDEIICGKGFDRYSARAGDKVDDSCEQRVPTLILNRGREQA